MSRLKINLSKSRDFYSIGTPQAKFNRLSSISGIHNTTSLDKYLGCPMLKGRAKRSDFLFIIEKMQTGLASWKNKLLNKSGRWALTSFVLSSIHSYYMQIAWLHQSICDSIDQTTQNFIWKDSNNKGIHLVGWKKIVRPKHQGGLGIITTRETYIFLLGKLVWDLLHNFGLISSPTGMLLSLIFFMQPPVLVTRPLGPLLFMLKMSSKIVSLGALDRETPPFVELSWVHRNFSSLHWYPWFALDCQRCALYNWPSHLRFIHLTLSFGFRCHQQHSH